MLSALASYVIYPPAMRIVCLVCLLFFSFPVFAVDSDSCEKYLAAERVYEKRGVGVTEEIRREDNGIIGHIFSGIPVGVKLIDVSGQIFRHFTNAVEKIKKSSTLKAGGAPYVDPIAPGKIYHEWSDVTGIFFTTADVGPRAAYRITGLTQPGWVNFRFPPGTKAIFLQEMYYVIPSKEGFELPIEIVDSYDPFDPVDQKRFPKKDIFHLDERR